MADIFLAVTAATCAVLAIFLLVDTILQSAREARRRRDRIRRRLTSIIHADNYRPEIEPFYDWRREPDTGK